VQRSHALRIFTRILEPSWAGSVFSLLFAAVITSVLVLPVLLDDPLLQSYIKLVETTDAGFASDVTRLGELIFQSEIAGIVSVFLFWSVAGLILYFALQSILDTVSNTVRFMKVFNYFKYQRKEIEHELFLAFAVRVIALICMYGFYYATITLIVPTILLILSQGLDSGWFIALSSAVASFVTISVMCHIIIVLTRIILLRYRIFKPSYELPVS
jgi:hypothetical protein